MKQTKTFQKRFVLISLCIICIFAFQNTKANISLITSDSKDTLVNSQATNPFETLFNSAGTKMYVLDYDSDTIYQYTLSTPWDVSTASYDTVSFSVTTQEAVPEGMFFKPDGSTLYVVGVSGDKVFQYTLSTPWDLSTASYTSKSSPSNSANDDTTVKVHFNSDGSQMYLTGFINSRVYQYTLSTPWDVSTATDDSISFSVSQAANSYATTFSHDGKTLLAVSPSDIIYQYSLSTAWDITTANYDTLSYNFNTIDSNLYGITFKNDDTKIFITGSQNKKVYQYSIDLSDNTNPTIQTFSPSDNATGVAIDANLVITFSETVDRKTGNIVLKKTSDDSIVETIDVTSGLITGTGTNTITINPTSDFSELTEYYVQIDATAFDDSSSNSYAGIVDTTTWSFTTADTTAPTASNVTSVPADTTATITWTTDENASSQIEYGLTTSYGNQTIEADTSPRVTSHSVALSGLNACTLYYYRIKSTDAGTNTLTGSGRIFTTNGCEGSASVVTSNDQSITKVAGGSLQLISGTANIMLTVPINFAAPPSAEFQLHQITTTDVINNIGSPSNKSVVGNHTYNLLALTDINSTITTFDNPITVTITYTNSEISNLIESSLKIYRWNGAAWAELNNCTINTGTNTVSCETSNFSTFGVFGSTSIISTSSGGGGSFVAKADSTTGTAKMKEWGGYVSKSISDSSSLSVDFPEKTFKEEVTVSIIPKTLSDYPALPEGFELVENLIADIDISYRYGGDSMENPGTVSFQYTPTEEPFSLLSLYHFNETSQAWEYVSATREKQLTDQVTVELETKIFSVFALVGKRTGIVEDSFHSSAGIFSDVSPSHENEIAIRWMKENGIVEGYSDGTYKPEQKVNRAEFVKILVETVATQEEIDQCTQATFSDIPSRVWYAPYVCVAQQKDIISGYPDGTFRAEQNITFPEAAKVMANTLELELPDTNGEWYESYVEALSNVNAIPRSITNLLHEVNRGEMAEQVWRIKTNVSNLPSRSSQEF